MVLTAKQRDFDDPFRAENLAATPEVVRQQMRQRCLKETYYFAKLILGYRKLTPHTHGPMCTFLDTCTAKRRLIQMPRSHFKCWERSYAQEELRYVQAEYYDGAVIPAERLIVEDAGTVAPILEITTTYGKRLRVTPNHPFMCGLVKKSGVTNWQTAVELRPGTLVAAPVNMPFGVEHLPLLSELVGYMLGDGNLPQMRFYQQDVTVHDRIAYLADMCGGEAVPIFQANRTSCTSIRGLRNAFRAVGVDLTWHSADKRVPRKILHGDRETVKAFLQALFACDATDKSGRKPKPVTYVTISPGLAKDVQRLLAGFGIAGRLQRIVHHTLGGYISYRVVFRDTANIWRNQEPSSQDHIFGDFCWDEIKGIRYLGDMPIISIESNPAHTLTLGGLVTHNTTIVTVTKRIQDYLNDPAIRVLIVGNTGSNVQKHLGKLRNQFMANRLLRWLFPERVWEDISQAQSWSKDMIYLPNDAMHGEPTFDTIGAAGEATSRHYNLINADDLIGEDEYYSETEMARVIEWSTGLESLFVPPIDDGQLDIPSTFWRTDDVYAFFEKFYGHNEDPVKTGPYSYQRGEIAVFRRSARENGQPIFPEGVTNKFLDRLQERNPERYAAQYANDPYSADVAYFKPQYLKYYQWHTPDYTIKIRHDETHTEIIRLDSLYMVGLCDPHAGGDAARSRFRRGGRAAVLMTGVQPEKGRVFILDAWIKRAPTDLIIDEIFRQNEKWNPSLFSIEANGLQKMLRFWIDERAVRDGLPSIPYHPYIPKGGKHEEARIKGLQPLFRAGQIWLVPGFDELIEEYRAWPRGAQDGMDALAQGLEYWNIGFTSAEDMLLLEEYEQQMNRERSIATGY